LNFYRDIPADLINFILVTVFSLLIGLEQRRHHINEPKEQLFGTDRTLTLIGILGFVLYVSDKQHMWLFMGGFFVLGVLMAGYYFFRISIFKRFGLTTVITALITYCLAPLVYLQPHWLTILVVVCILLLTEIKETLSQFTSKFDDKEFITLAVFLALSGVILPLLPDKPVLSYLPVSPYKFWLALIVVSGISYASYLLQKFIFPNSGIMLTGLLGGLYSSTATTVILAKKSRENKEQSRTYLPAIFIATAMMYLRIFFIALIFSVAVAKLLLLPFMVLFAGSIAAAFILKQKEAPVADPQIAGIHTKSNPLEFKIALIFAVLFVFFGFITSWVLKEYGNNGVYVLSFIVGVTDIDPFILNLLQSNWHLADIILAVAILNATTSNNLLKLSYAIVLGDKTIRKRLLAGFGSLFIIGILLFVILLHFAI
jgi:uncharacterized membrane protein (DUF4010 family)